MRFISRNKMKLIFLFVVFLRSASGQDASNINVLFVNEAGNEVSEKAVEAAVKLVDEKNQLKVQLTKVVANRMEAVDLLEKLCHVYGEMTSSGPVHLVLDTTITGLSSEVVKSFTSAVALPTVSASYGQEGDLMKWRRLNYEQKKYLIQINTPSDVIPDIVRDLIERQNITNAAVLYDTSFVMKHRYKSLFQNLATRNVITAVDDARLEEQIQKIRAMDLVNFFVLARLETIKKVLEIASRNSLLTKSVMWHVITMENGEIACNCTEGRILVVRPSLSEITTEEKDNYDLSGSFYGEFATQSFLAVRSLLEDDWSKVVPDYITCDDYNGTNTPQRPGLNLDVALQKVTSEKIINIISNGKNRMQFIMDLNIVTFTDGKVANTTLVGTWDSISNVSLTVTDEALMDTFLSAQIYRVVVAEQKPFVFKDPNHPLGYNGYCIDLIQMIAENLDFQFEIRLATGNVVGYMNEAGEWNGIVKDLMDKRADIGVGSISVMAERETVIDYTVPFYEPVGYLILMKSSNIPPSLFKFLTVLEDEVWICILVSYLITSFLLWIFDKYSPYSYQNNKEKYKDDEEKRIFNLRESLWFCMTSLTPQGGGEAPKNLSGRLVAATWWLFGFIIIASYTANLAAFLTVSRLESPIESLDDLSKQYKISYAPVNGSTAMTYFVRMSNIENKFYEIWKEMSLNDSLSEVERSKLAVWDYPVSDRFTKIWQAMQDTGLPSSLEEAARKVKTSRSATDGFAFIGDATDIRFLDLINCDLKIAGEEFSAKPYALAVQQGSPIREKLDTGILHLINRRYLESLRKKWWDNNPEKMKCMDPEDPSEGISLHNIGGVFIVIIAGIGLACATISFEYWYYKKEKRMHVITLRGSSKADMYGKIN